MFPHIKLRLRLFALVSACILVPAGGIFFSCFAQEIRYALEMNRIPIECRSVAMGGTGVALYRDAAVSYWNPALPAFNKNYYVSVEGAKLYSNLSDLGAVSLSAMIQKGLNIGALYTGLLSGDITEWDTLEGELLERLYNPELRASEDDGTGVFHNNQHRIQLFVARLFPIRIPRPAGVGVPLPVEFAAGMNCKYYWQTMTPQNDIRMGMNINLDFGAALSIGVDYDIEKNEVTRRILIGIAFSDFLPTKVSWVQSPIDYKEPVHGSQSYGISYSDRTGFLMANWTASLALIKQYEVAVHAGIEAEFWNTVAFRAGIADRRPALGAGIRTDIFRIDYAITFDELAVTPLRLTIGFYF
jgi:hypothetical protein